MLPVLLVLARSRLDGLEVLVIDVLPPNIALEIHVVLGLHRPYVKLF